MNILRKQSDLQFSGMNNHKKEKSMASFTHEQKIIFRQTQLNDIGQSRS